MIDEEVFNGWIMAFHKLRIQGFMTEAEKKKIWDRIAKAIYEGGYKFEDIGFYQYKFEKLESE